MFRASRPHEEGRFARSSRHAGRDAMAAAASGASRASRSMRAAGGQVVWSWHPWAGAKFAGGDPQATVTNKVMDTGEITKQPSNPLRRECRCSASPVVTALMCFSHSHMGLWVRPAPGIPCALFLIFRGQADASLGRTRRGNAKVCPRHCEEPATKLRSNFAQERRSNPACRW
jgi:hypothetical protein